MVLILTRKFTIICFHNSFHKQDNELTPDSNKIDKALKNVLTNALADQWKSKRDLINPPALNATTTLITQSQTVVLILTRKFTIICFHNSFHKQDNELTPDSNKIDKALKNVLTNALADQWKSKRDLINPPAQDETRTNSTMMDHMSP